MKTPKRPRVPTLAEFDKMLANNPLHQPLMQLRESRARACENARQWPAHVKMPGKCWACGQPNNHSAAALHLVP